MSDLCTDREFNELDNRIALLQDALTKVLKKASVIREDAFPDGPNLLVAAADFCSDENKLKQQIPSACYIQGLAKTVKENEETEKSNKKIQKFRERCSKEIIRWAKVGDTICNFAYYADEVFDVVLKELKDKGYEVTVYDPDRMGHRMVVIKWEDCLATKQTGH